MPSIADLFVTVTSDVSGALAGLTSVDQKVNGTSSAMAAAAPAGYALAGAAGAVGAAFLSSIGTAADFEKQMGGIKAVLSPNEVVQFGAALSDLALKLGKDTVFTAREAAGGIEELIKAGVAAKDVINGAAEASLALAAATGIPVSEAAKLAAQAMNIFGKTADDLGRKGGVVDFLAGTANASAASMSDLAFGLQSVGAVANLVGLSFEDTATAIGLFANNGLRGSDAGTSLKTMLINLEPQTAKQKEAFNNLGLSTFDTAKALAFLAENGITVAEGDMAGLTSALAKQIIGIDDFSEATKAQIKTYDDTTRSLGIMGNAFFDSSGKAKGLGEISQVLQNALQGMSEEQQIATLKILFGTDAMRAAAILTREGAAGFDTLKTSIGGISAADGARLRMDNLNGSLQQLGGSFETVQIQIGNAFLPVLRQIVDGVTGLLNAFLTLDPGIQVAIVAVVGIAGAAAGLLAGFILLSPVLAALGAAFGIIGAAAAAVALPLAALVAAAALLYAAWQTNFGGIRDVTEQVGIAIQPALKNIQDFVTLLGASLGPAFSGAQSALAPFITALSNDLAPILARLPDLIRLIGDGFNLLSGPAQAIVSIIQILATGNYNGGIFGLGPDSGVVQFFVGVHDAIALFYDAVLKLLQGDFSGAWNSLWNSFTTVLQVALTAELQLLQTIGGAIVTFLQAIPGWVAQNVPGLWNALIAEFGKLPAQLAPAWQAFADWLAGVAAGIPQFVADKAGDIWGKLKEAFNGAVDVLSPAWDAFAGWLARVAGGIPQFIADNAGDADLIWGTLKGGFEGATEILSPAWQAFADWLAGVAGGIPQFIADSAGGIWDILKTLFEGAEEKLTPAWTTFAGWLGGVAGGIPQWIADKAGNIWSELAKLIEGYFEFVEPAWDKFAGWLAAVAGGIPQFIADKAGNIWSELVKLFEGFAEFVQPAWDKFAGWLKGVVSGIPQFIADNIGNVWGALTTALQNFPGSLLGGGTPGGTTTPPGGVPAPEPGPIGAGAGITGPLVTIGTLNVGSAAEVDAFLQAMADAILAAAQRVSAPPPSNSPFLP